jgi:hypothetical protein
VQADLNLPGLNAGPVNIVAGVATRRATRAFRRRIGQDGARLLTPAEDRVLPAAAARFGPIELRHESLLALDVDGAPRAVPGLATGGNLHDHRNGRNARRPHPTRLLAGPGQFPPGGFRGFGFLAFSASTPDCDVGRHRMICPA